MPAAPCCGADRVLPIRARTDSLRARGVRGQPVSFGQALKRRVKSALPPLGFLALCGYFAWHAVHGDFGLQARDRRLAEIAEARAVLARAEAERDAMERRVAGLRGGRMDRDQLDERARTLLNMVGRDEIVIPYEGRRLY